MHKCGADRPLLNSLAGAFSRTRNPRPRKPGCPFKARASALGRYATGRLRGHPSGPPLAKPRKATPAKRYALRNPDAKRLRARLTPAPPRPHGPCTTCRRIQILRCQEFRREDCRLSPMLVAPALRVLLRNRAPAVLPLAPTGEQSLLSKLAPSPPVRRLRERGVRRHRRPGIP